MRLIPNLVIIMAVSLPLVLSSCDSPLQSSEDENGVFEVILHDAPGDYEHVWVDIQEVRVNRQQDAEEGEGGWQVVASPEQRYDLLELVNGAHEVLGQEELEPGTYRQIRLVLGDDNTVVVDGEEYELQTPSAQQSGLKLNIDAEIESGITYTMMLDFDASRSIVEKGQAAAGSPYLLKPVIKASHQAVTGSIAGEVEPLESRPWVYAIADEDTVSTTRTDEESGEFQLIGVEEGTYEVAFEPVEGYTSQSVEDVEVEIGETTNLGSIEIEENTDEE